MRRNETHCAHHRSHDFSDNKHFAFVPELYRTTVDDFQFYFLHICYWSEDIEVGANMFQRTTNDSHVISFFLSILSFSSRAILLLDYSVFLVVPSPYCFSSCQKLLLGWLLFDILQFCAMCSSIPRLKQQMLHFLLYFSGLFIALLLIGVAGVPILASISLLLLVWVSFVYLVLEKCHWHVVPAPFPVSIYAVVAA